MMHQPIKPSEAVVDDRPERDRIIEKDEITGLVIDLNVLSPEELYEKYFEVED